MGKKEQEEKERATEDFIAMIDKQLEDMENNKSTNPKQKTEAISAILERHFSDKEKKENSKETGAIPETTDDSVKKVESPETVEETVDEKKADETVDEVM